MKIYIDDIIVKSLAISSHLNHLTMDFERIRKHQLKMSLFKYAFRVQAQNFLGFVIH